MTSDLSSPSERQHHWDTVYSSHDVGSTSWFERAASTSLELLHLLGCDVDDSIVDVGGGESTLVDALVDLGMTDITVLDVSKVALERSRERVGDRASITWLCNDVLSWRPERLYDVWHDRAVFHFLHGDDVRVYVELVKRALAPGGSIVVGTFAPEGPEYCSGLAVSRYAHEELMALLGSSFELKVHREINHVTPRGVVQPFTWIGAQRS